jgi:hypothetical protein
MKSKTPEERIAEAKARNLPAPANLPLTEEAIQQAEILARRIENPVLGGSTAIRLQTPGLICRWINTEVYTGRYQTAVRLQGWLPVKVTDLLDLREVHDLVASPDGYVTRGEKGKEILCAMPEADYRRIQWAKAEKNRKKSTPAALRDEIATRAAAHPPFQERGVADEAATSIGRMSESRLTQIVSGVERIEVTDGPTAE